MRLFDMFRRGGRIRDTASLGSFIDKQAAALAQRSVEDYARLRAGDQAEALFAEPAFRAAVERARAEAYPLALAMVGETVEGVLRPHAGEREHPMLYGLIRLILDIFDRKPMPQAIGAWRATRQQLAQAINELARGPAITVEKIAESYSGLFLALMPIHAKLRGEDFPALRNQLGAMLRSARDQFIESADLPGLIDQLCAAEGAP